MIQALYKLWGALPMPQWLRWQIVWRMVPKFAVGVVGVVFNDAGEILLLRHTYRGSRYPWGLPSGWLDPREDPADCVVREFREETGLEVRVIRPVRSENARIVRRIDLVFLCEIVRGEFHPSDEVDAMQFFSRDTLPDMLITQRKQIEKLMTRYEETHTQF